MNLFIIKIQKKIGKKLEDILRNSWDDIVERTKNPGIRGITTGIHGLDLATSGMNGGDLWMKICQVHFK